MFERYDSLQTQQSPPPGKYESNFLIKLNIKKERKDHGFLLFFFLTRECVNYLPDIADSECNDAA